MGLALSVLYWPFSEIDIGRRYGSEPRPGYSEALLAELDRVEAHVNAKDHLFVRTVDEFDVALSADKVAFMHCVEGGFHLGSTAEEVTATVKTLAEKGCAYITIAHLFWRRVATNAPAIPFLPDWLYNLLFPQETDEPLGELGAVAIKAMYEHHVLIDIAHMRADAVTATFDLVEQLDEETGADPSDHPIIATHVGMRLKPGGQQYNLDENVVQRIARRGGVIGLIMAQHQLNEGAGVKETKSLEKSMEVIFQHLAKLNGWAGSDDVAALGTDLDGFIKPTMGGIERAGDLAALTQCLEREYASRADKIVRDNAVRVIRGTLERRANPAPAPGPRLRPDRKPQKQGLALSGGGHRAAFFHIGVLARLAERDELRRVRVISTVSGGSIVGVLYYLHVKALLEALPDEKLTRVHYIRAVRSVEHLYLAAVSRNVRGRALLDYFRDFRLASPSFSRTNRCAELYDSWFFRSLRYDSETELFVQARAGRWGADPQRMSSLLIAPLGADGSRDIAFDPASEANDARDAVVPIILINATALNTGHAFRFDARGMGEPPMASQVQKDINPNARLTRTPYTELAGADRMPTLGTAVAASAAFPGGMAPITLTGLYKVDGRSYVIRLSDGGVHDNQGVDGLLDNDCDRLLVSDGSGQMEDVPKPNGTLPAVLARVSSIAGGSAREQRLLRAELEPDVETVLMHLRSGLPVEVARGGAAAAPARAHETDVDPKIDSRAQHAIARTRTDLDAFSDLEAAAIMGVGYRVAGAVARELRAPGAWWFSEVDGLLQTPDGPFLRRLHVSSARLFKPLLLFVAWTSRADRTMRGTQSEPGARPAGSRRHAVVRVAMTLAAAALAIAALVWFLSGLDGQHVPATALAGSIVLLGGGVALYVRGRGLLTRVVCECLIPLVLALSGALSLVSAVFMVDGALHRSFGRVGDRGIAPVFVRGFGRAVVAALAVAVTGGIIAAGVAAEVGLLDSAVNKPVSLGELLIFHAVAKAIGCGALAFGLGSAVMLLFGLWREWRGAIAVGCGVVLSVAALIGAVFLTAQVLSLLGYRGGLPPSLPAAYLEMFGIALIVAVLVTSSMGLALRWIARRRNVEGTILPVGVALAVTLLIAIPVTLTSSPVPPGDPAAGWRPPTPRLIDYKALATEYAPELRFDSHERRRPLDVDEFLAQTVDGHSAQQLCDPGCASLPIQPGARRQALMAASPSATLKVDTSQGTRDSPIYYNVTRAADHLYLDYWVFYNFNDSPALPSLTCVAGISIADATCFDHEGDWEGVTVRLPATVDPATTYPDAVIYATHSSTALFSWHRLQAIGATDGRHVVAYVAYGSHASYPLPCRAGVRSCRQLDSDLPDGERDGRGTWAPAGCRGCLKPFPQMAKNFRPKGWAAFRGRWGTAVCTIGFKLCSRSQGPLTPTYQRRYQNPAGAIPCDNILPLSATAPLPGESSCREATSARAHT